MPAVASSTNSWPNCSMTSHARSGWMRVACACAPISPFQLQNAQERGVVSGSAFIGRLPDDGEDGGASLLETDGEHRLARCLGPLVIWVRNLPHRSHDAVAHF